MPKTWLVTGSSRGLGREITLAALQAGDNVVATARNPEHLKTLTDTWGDNVLAVALDVKDPVAAKRAVEAAVNQFGHLDVVVNNAGKADLVAVEDTTFEMFHNQVETVFFGVVNVTKAALPVLRAQGSGHIIQISSLGARLGLAGLSAYQSSKWAVTGFSKVLADEVGPLGIKVTIVEPGSIRTNMSGGDTMEIPPVSAPYANTVGQVAKRLVSSHGKEPCDPVKMGSFVVALTRMDNPPVRILAGSDALQAAKALSDTLCTDDEKWQDLSKTVDY